MTNIIEEDYRDELRADSSQLIFPIVTGFVLAVCFGAILAANSLTASGPAAHCSPGAI